MEQKLAEFRARKKVEKQATKSENPPESCCCETQTAPNDATKSTESNTTVKEASIIYPFPLHVNKLTGFKVCSQLITINFTTAGWGKIVGKKRQYVLKSITCLQIY